MTVAINETSGTALSDLWKLGSFFLARLRAGARVLSNVSGIDTTRASAFVNT